MVGGTKLPPQDSESGPWSHEHKAKTTPKATPKPKPSTKGKRKTLWSVEVSLDNADTVIEGGPSQGALLIEACRVFIPAISPLKSFLNNRGHESDNLLVETSIHC
jgi:hypothetical protein